MGNTIYKFEIQNIWRICAHECQSDKRMIHMVDDLLGGPEQNKEERITCI